MLPGLEMLMSCPNLAVPAEVMRHVVNVESGANPFAIGVVGGHLVRQPVNLDEAVATANMLETKGYNYSLGLAQVNRVNFAKYGLDTPAKAFDVCANLSAGSHILADCYRNARGDWGKAFSCYYSGNFITGFLQGYVQKIYHSILNSIQTAAAPAPAVAIPLAGPLSPLNYALMAAATKSTVRHEPAARGGILTTSAQRIAMRSVQIINDPANVDAKPMTVLLPVPVTPASTARPVTAGHDGATGEATAPRSPVAVQAPQAGDIFEPQVHGPNDLLPVPATDMAIAAPHSTASTDSNAVAGPNQKASDSAFVF